MRFILSAVSFRLPICAVLLLFVSAGCGTPDKNSPNAAPKGSESSPKGNFSETGGKSSSPSVPIKSENQAPKPDANPHDASDSQESKPVVPSKAGKADKLLSAEDLKYLGAFRLPDTDSKLASRFPYGGWTAAFNPDGNKGKGSLFIGGHDHHQLVAEVTIPEPVKDREPKNLNTATLLQPFSDVTGGLKNAEVLKPFAEAVGGAKEILEHQTRLGGMHVYKGKILWDIYSFYNVTGINLPSHGVSELNLAQPKSKGLWYISGFHIQKTAGFMCTIPAPWDKEIGFPLLTGSQRSTGRATSSDGPVAFGFDPTEKGAFPANGAKLSSTQFLCYDIVHPFEYDWKGKVHKWKGANFVAGMVFPVSGDGERAAVIYFAKIGLHPTDWYGIGSTFPGPGTPDSGASGYHAPPYKAVAWFYDPANLKKVSTGAAEPWSIKPYLQLDVSDFLFTDPHRVGAVAYDPTSRRILVTELFADQKNQYESWPVVHVFQVK